MSDAAATPDLDLRLVRYFMVVAENKHFGRAAAELHLAQPSLSRQIQRLEQVLGVQLMERGPQGTSLTAAGRDFMVQAQALLGAAADAVARVRAIASQPRIVVGYASNLIVTPAAQVLRQEYPDAEVKTLHLDWNEPAAALADRRVDVVVARLPFATDDLHVTSLYEEPRVLVVSTGHHLAGRQSVRQEEIRDEVFAVFPDPEWNEFWQAGSTVTPAPEGTRVQSIEDNLELVASGRAVTLAPASVRHTRLRPDVVPVPVEDIEPVRVVAASRRGDRNPLVRRFHTLAMARL
ncbi:LysR family transcriptional regulator [Streptomyces sp. SRF1]|uniref:LysR family transcriptional regulator n=1 Tax=Streptomyces sp. SRF1 TaxID=1549642 RepID=UPI0025B06BC8|nr:LysR family transcriptional regulator [Streptomyces sp. SRF1]MDN3060059.1 LysR family transcriptional regulator [Streptomyces sp. SRF1]